MLLDLLLTGNIQSAIISFLLSVPIIILVLSVHEYAHGLVAKKLGDPTADSLGRLTLNPLKHIDPIGFLMFLLLGIGYAKPVPINSRYFKKPRRDMALVGAAGPLSNLAMALIFTFLTKLFFLLVPFLPETAPDWSYTALSYMHTILRLGIFYNLSFMIFNFIPVPPLDGSRVLSLILPPRLFYKYVRYERQITLIVLLLLLLGPLSRLIQLITTLILRGMFAAVGMSGFLI